MYYVAHRDQATHGTETVSPLGSVTGEESTMASNFEQQFYYVHKLKRFFRDWEISCSDTIFKNFTFKWLDIISYTL